ncbi:hypothetical protein G5C51_39485, partial [Streptomyces sp. A7024]|nr:hypothetical protein [Streptomyces coryli]
PAPVPLHRVLRRQVGRLLRASGLLAPVPAKKAARPTAGCRVARGTGDLVFRLPAKRLPEGARGIVLRRRGSEPREEIRVRLGKRPAADGYAEATVARAAHRLADGRWDCYLDLGPGAKPKRLRAGLVETQHLLSLTPPRPGADEVAQWIPYPTSDGYLAVRTWLRAGHAEVTSVVPEAGAFRVHATLHGRARAGELCAVIARSRKGERYEFHVMAQPLGEGDIAFELPYTLAEAHREGGHDLWDLWVVPSFGAQPVRLGRVFGDRVSRKDTDVFAAHERKTGMNGPVRLRPYLTVHNNLALSARDLANVDGLTEADLALLRPQPAGSAGSEWRAA